MLLLDYKAAAADARAPALSADDDDLSSAAAGAPWAQGKRLDNEKSCWISPVVHLGRPWV
jgi:hypothetical protein